jgi:hypothetical protein
LDPIRKKEVKFKFCAYNSTFRVRGFYFNEVTSEAYASDPTNTLVRMHYAPFKRVEFTESLFELMNQIAFTYEGVNIHIYNSTVNVSQQNQIGLFIALPECSFFRTEGIGNNVILDNVKFIGQNRGKGLGRIFLISLPQNVTMTNLQFIDF